LPDSYYLAFDAIAADAQNEILVAESAGRVIGALQITYLPNMNYQGSWRALIESVRIAENFRGGGAGSALMQAAIERSRQRGCRIVQLTTDKRRARAKRFYEKLGFCATHEGMKLHLR
jgi:ribosomal protein S18 acetylase RimI-like enzyme